MADIYEVYQDRILKNGVAVDPVISFRWSSPGDLSKTAGYGSRWGKDLTWVSQAAKDGDKIYIRQGGTYYVPVIYRNLFTILDEEDIAYPSETVLNVKAYNNDRSTYLGRYRDPKRGAHTSKDVDLIAEVTDGSGPVLVEMSAPTDESYIYPVFAGTAPYEFYIFQACRHPPHIVAGFKLMFSSFETVLPFNHVRNIEFVRYSGKGSAFRTVEKTHMHDGDQGRYGYGYLFYSKYSGFGDTANVFENCKFTDVNVDLWGTSSLIDCVFDGTNGPILHNPEAVKSSGIVDRCKFVGCTNTSYILKHPMVTNCLFRENTCGFPCCGGIVSNCAFISNTGTSETDKLTFVLNSYFKENTFFDDYKHLLDPYKAGGVPRVDGLLCRTGEYLTQYKLDKDGKIAVSKSYSYASVPFLYNCVVDSECAAGYLYKRCVVSSLLTANPDRHTVDGPAMDFDNMVGTGFSLQYALDRLSFESTGGTGEPLDLMYSYYYKNKGVDPLSRDLNNVERASGVVSIGPVEQDLSQYSVVRAHMVEGLGSISHGTRVVHTGKEVRFTVSGTVTNVVIDTEPVAASNTIVFVTSKPVHDVYISTERTVYVSKDRGIAYSTGLGGELMPFKDLSLALLYLLNRYRGVFSYVTPRYVSLIDDWHCALFTSNYDRFQGATCDCRSFIGDGCFKIVVIDGEVSCGAEYYIGASSNYTLDKIEIVFNEGASLNGLDLYPSVEFILRGSSTGTKCSGLISYNDGTYGPTYTQWFDYIDQTAKTGYVQNTVPDPEYSRQIHLNRLVFDDCSIANHPKNLVTVSSCSGQLPKDVKYSTWDKPFGTKYVGCDFAVTSAVNSVSTFIACYMHDQPVSEYEKVKHMSECTFESCYISNCPRLEGTKNNCFVTGMYDNEIVSGTENDEGVHGKGSAEYDPYVRSSVYNSSEPRVAKAGALGPSPTYIAGRWPVDTNSLLNGDNDKLRPEHSRYIEIKDATYADGSKVKELKPISYFPPYSARLGMASKKSDGSGTIYADGDVVPFSVGLFSPRNDPAGSVSEPGYIPKSVDTYLKSNGCDLDGMFSDLRFAVATLVWFSRYSAENRYPARTLLELAAANASRGIEQNSEIAFPLHNGSYQYAITRSRITTIILYQEYVNRSKAYQWVYAALTHSTKPWEGFDGLTYCVLPGCGVFNVGKECLDGFIHDAQRKELGDQYSIALALLRYDHVGARGKWSEVIQEAEEAIDDGSFESRLKVTAEGDLIFGDDAGRKVDYGLQVFDSGDRYYAPGGYSVDYDKCTLKWAVYDALKFSGNTLEYTNYYIPSLKKSIRGFKLPRRT